MINDLRQFTLYVLILVVLIVPMGMWLARTFSSPSHGTLERLTYKVIGIDPEEKMSWKRYGVALLLSNAAMMGLGYFILRLQNLLPFDPLGRSAQRPDLAEFPIFPWLASPKKPRSKYWFACFRDANTQE